MKGLNVGRHCHVHSHLVNAGQQCTLLGSEIQWHDRCNMPLTESFMESIDDTAIKIRNVHSFRSKNSHAQNPLAMRNTQSHTRNVLWTMMSFNMTVSNITTAMILVMPIIRSSPVIFGFGAGEFILFYISV